MGRCARRSAAADDDHAQRMLGAEAGQAARQRRWRPVAALHACAPQRVGLDRGADDRARQHPRHAGDGRPGRRIRRHRRTAPRRHRARRWHVARAVEHRATRTPAHPGAARRADRPVQSPLHGGRTRTAVRRKRPRRARFVDHHDRSRSLQEHQRRTRARGRRQHFARRRPAAAGRPAQDRRRLSLWRRGTRRRPTQLRPRPRRRPCRGDPQPDCRAVERL